MHQRHPLHFSSSTIIIPDAASWTNASLGQAATHGGSSQSLQVTERLMRPLKRMTLIRDFKGLKRFSLVIAHAYSHTAQPTHLSGSAETNFRSLAIAKLRFLLCWSLLRRFSSVFHNVDVFFHSNFLQFFNGRYAFFCPSSNFIIVAQE